MKTKPTSPKTISPALWGGLACLVLALVLELLPTGVVLMFADGPGQQIPQSFSGKEQTDQDQGDGQAGTDVGHRYNGISYLNRKIALRILDSVAGLMGRHADSGCGGPVTDAV